MNIVPDRLEKEINEGISKLREQGRKYIYRIEIPIERTDILIWLSHQPNRLKFYYQDPGLQYEMGGIGAAHIIEGEISENYDTIFKKALPGDDRVRYYGGLRFLSKYKWAEEWEPYGSYRFFVPKYEIIARKGIFFLAYNFADRTKKDIDDLRNLVFVFDNPVYNQPELMKRTNIPDFEMWHEMVDAVQKKIEERLFSKIVLARKTILEFDRQLNPFLVLKRLKRTIAKSILFLLQPDADSVFIGATPELLFRRTGRRIFSEIIAGTRSRGKNIVEDKKLARALMESEKERLEHKIVFDGVTDAFKSFCRTVIPNGNISILQLNRVQHLYNTISGILETKKNDADILKYLHPTPAVGGYPKEESLKFIAHIESFDRGWYSGPTGWFNREAACFSVAIRSGLIEQNRLSLYSGAGIVIGSRALAEWEEIESKIVNFLQAVHVTTVPEKHQHSLGMLDHRRTFKERY